MNKSTFAEFNRQTNREREAKREEFMRRGTNAETPAKRRYWMRRANSLAWEFDS